MALSAVKDPRRRMERESQARSGLTLPQQVACRRGQHHSCYPRCLPYLTFPLSSQSVSGPNRAFRIRTVCSRGPPEQVPTAGPGSSQLARPFLSFRRAAAMLPRPCVLPLLCFIIFRMCRFGSTSLRTQNFHHLSCDDWIAWAP